MTKRTRRTPASRHQSTIRDTWGDLWFVSERRPTNYGFSVYLGWPYVNGGVKRSGKARFILTPALAQHLHRTMQRPHFLPLPIGRKALRRLRKQLGVDHRAWIDRKIYWWVDRIDDLATLSALKFAAKHSANAWSRSGAVSSTLVWAMRAILLGPGLVNPTGKRLKLYREP